MFELIESKWHIKICQD